MKFQVFVFILYFYINDCGSTKSPKNQVVNANLSQQSLPTTTLLSNKSNNSESGRIEVLEAPLKLDNDKKSYRVIRLSNGLKALLISTQENEKELDGGEVDNKSVEYSEFHQKLSACNLGIDVGSLSDPRDVQGLAHFIGNFNV